MSASATGSPSAAFSSLLDSPLNVLLLTQNIGSVECSTLEMTPENKEMALNWTKSVATFIEQEEERAGGKPMDLVVIHIQEIGGKKFNAAFNKFLPSIVQHCNPRAAWCSGLLMPDEDDGITFTAMGTIIFLSSRIAQVSSMLSFRHRTFISVLDDPVSWVKSTRALFFGAKFSNADTSRKGFLLTTLRIGNKIFNFLNAHLFHDADNTVAAKQCPSEYALKRASAMVEAVTDIAAVVDNRDPLYIFGDLNLRLDTNGLKAFFEKQFDEPIKLDKKKVVASSKVWDYIQRAQHWPELKKYDSDAAVVMKSVSSITGFNLGELEVGFGPTYLLEDEFTKARLNESNHDFDKSNDFHGDDAALLACYKHERFPAWCDRVFFNEAGAALLGERAAYWNAPLHPMDHLPVYLRFENRHIV